MLDPVIPTEFCAKSLFSFRKKTQYVIPFIKCMISYNSYRLLTNIPLTGTIGKVVNLIFDKYLDIKIKRQKFQKIIEIYILWNTFSFDENYYN